MSRLIDLDEALKRLQDFASEGDRAFDEGIGEAIEILQSLSPLDEQDSFSDSWSGFMEFLDRRYPEDIFGAGKDPGPMIVRLSRELAKHELSLSPPSSSRGAGLITKEWLDTMIDDVFAKAPSHRTGKRRVRDAILERLARLDPSAALPSRGVQPEGLEEIVTALNAEIDRKKTWDMESEAWYTEGLNFALQLIDVKTERFLTEGTDNV